jgi:hypothetical protein
MISTSPVFPHNGIVEFSDSNSDGYGDGIEKEIYCCEIRKKQNRKSNVLIY